MRDKTKSKKTEYWRNIIAECENSHMKKKDWMELHSINPKSYYRWHKYFKTPDNNSNGNMGSGFGELLPVPPVQNKIGSSAVIHIGNAEIMINDSISEDLLEKVIRAASNV